MMQHQKLLLKKNHQLDMFLNLYGEIFSVIMCVSLATWSGPS